MQAVMLHVMLIIEEKLVGVKLNLRYSYIYIA